MTINTREEYDKVLSVTWFVDDRGPEELTYVAVLPLRSLFPLVRVLTRRRLPCVLPFSKMYPLCCINIQNFVKQFSVFTRENFDHLNIVDKTLRKVYNCVSMTGIGFVIPSNRSPRPWTNS